MPVARAGRNSSSTARRRRQKMFRTSMPPEIVTSSPVYVHVYDMSRLNEYLGNIGLGVFHSGVEVYSREYCYGGHQFGGSGIFEMVPKDVANLGENYAFRTSIEMGRTDFTYADVCVILNNMEQDFCGHQYHLLRKNCNHFSHAFIEILCGASLPKWINRLAMVSTKLPFIERSIPREWLTPLQTLEDAGNPASAVNGLPPSRRSSAIGVLTSSVTEKHDLNMPFCVRQNNKSTKAGGAGLNGSRCGSVSDNLGSVIPPTSTKAVNPGSESWRRLFSQVQSYFQRDNASPSLRTPRLLNLYNTASTASSSSSSVKSTKHSTPSTSPAHLPSAQVTPVSAVPDRKNLRRS